MFLINQEMKYVESKIDNVIEVVEDAYITSVQNVVQSPLYDIPPSIGSMAEVDVCLTKYVKQQQVSPIIQALEQIFQKVITDFAEVSGGRGTSKIFKFKNQAKEYICRVTDNSRPAFFIDTDSETINMKIVNNLDIAPKLVHLDPVNCFMVMECVANVRLTPAILENEAQNKNIISELALRTKLLHRGPDFTQEVSSIFQDLDSTFKQVKRDYMPKEGIEIFEVIRKLESVLKRHQTSAPCHKDLHSNNVLYDGKKIYFIDWELGQNCDPFVDLASLSTFFIFNQTDEQAFLKGYFDREPTPQEQAHFFLMKQVVFCLYATRLFRGVTGIRNRDLSNENIDFEKLGSFRDFVLECYNGCQKSFSTEELKIFPFMFLREVMCNMKSPQYSTSIDILNS